jgi:hypothetical protein
LEVGIGRDGFHELPPGLGSKGWRSRMIVAGADDAVDHVRAARGDVLV